VIPEIELGLMISKDGKNIKESEWHEYVGGYFLCLDITDRGIFRKNSLNMAFVKGQDTFTPVHKLITPEEIINPQYIDLKLIVNGIDRVKGNTESMVNRIGKLIETCSHFMTLEAGDLILTGTLEPVGTIVAGDHIHAQMGHPDKVLSEFELYVEEA
jgi:acylpyruvate hydrolase